MENNKHPWQAFLEARYNCILWLTQKGKSNDTIAFDLSMDEHQVFSIKLVMEKRTMKNV
jgi:hypothetical protein